MCTVLQQHLARQLNGTNGFSDSPDHGDPTDQNYARTTSPIRLQPNNTTYSYLGAAQDGPLMKRQIEPYDRKKSAPAHFHYYSNPDGTRPSSRAKNAYRDALWGRSRSHSRTGMRVMLAEIEAHSTPRPKSPHMNNEEPISFSHYPDGHPPNDNDEIDQGKPRNGGEEVQKRRKRKKKPIERDDFPAPPFPYVRRRHWSEPMKSSSSEDENEVEEVQQDSTEEEEEVPDPKLDQTENELKKISTGMASVFLVDLEKERIRRKSEKSSKFIDPRSAARTPAANRCPPFRLRYDSPVNASPSRIADHLNPWEDDVEGIRSRRSFFSATPFLPSTPGLVGGRISTTSPKGRKSSTLPSRNSPAHPGGGPLTYSTDFSTDISDGEGGKDSTGTPMVKPVRVSSAYAPTPESHMNGTHGTNGGGSLPNMPPSSLAATDDEGDMNGEEEYEYIPQASNVYPLHLLMTTNYRLPGDVDRCNLERHLTDAEFDAVFKCLRDEFYRLPYWKRCDLKRRIFLF